MFFFCVYQFCKIIKSKCTYYIQNKNVNILLSLQSHVFSASIGNLMGPSSSLLGSGDQNGHTLPGSTSNTCSAPMVPPTNGIYSSDGGASMLSCLLPSLPTLPSFSASHDVFRHGEMLRAGIAYHDSSRQHARHMQRTDVT